MNKVVLVGRLTKDPEVKVTSSQIQFVNFTVAVDRRFKDANGQRQADFINCVAWRQTASFISNYFHKGSRIGIVGSLQTRSYDGNDGQKRFVTEVLVDEAEFVDSGNGKAQPGDQMTSVPQPQAGSVAASAPTAPAKAIDDDVMSEDAFSSGNSGALPFEV
ncbi:single-strand DNA-binding protein [Ruminococcaceae bacterium YRB3002]|nr:single-strand DNA-binding protein [Ruminococcaceae bacterium YRB3002]